MKKQKPYRCIYELILQIQRWEMFHEKIEYSAVKGENWVLLPDGEIRLYLNSYNASKFLIQG